MIKMFLLNNLKLYRVWNWFPRKIKRKLSCPLSIKLKLSIQPPNLYWHTFQNRYCLGYRPITRIKLDKSCEIQFNEFSIKNLWNSLQKSRKIISNNSQQSILVRDQFDYKAIAIVSICTVSRVLTKSTNSVWLNLEFLVLNLKSVYMSDSI